MVVLSRIKSLLVYFPAVTSIFLCVGGKCKNLGVENVNPKIKMLFIHLFKLSSNKYHLTGGLTDAETLL